MLSPQVYLPAREGSLQPELLAATRRAEALLLPVAASLADDSGWKAAIDAALEELGARTGVDVLSCNVTRAP
jgi:NAD(P)-dependent dehydrogenase (short-subunit alcohol dehydrogenase family)